ncbi:MAG: prepilin-type N-terminal cleavage/methylation domain-containing protein [Planctomycetes bacterium]|nr:prepilin-type N-terminal cleavage/methylation domain-containing protein [Planctomycetota bacterium]
MRARAFTLIELVITIAITAIIVTSLGYILRSTVDSKIQVESEIRARRLGPGLMEIIARDLRNAWATGPDEQTEIDGSWFTGKHSGDDDRGEDELWFVTSVDSYMRYNGITSDLTEVGYYLKENEAEEGSPLAGLYSLYRREDFLVDKRPSEGGLGVKLHDRVVSFRVRYYDLPRDALDAEGNLDPAQLEEIVELGAGTETDTWDAKDQERLPYAVRIELILDATPADAYSRKQKKRYAVYETLVRLPDFPKLDNKFKLFNVQPPTAPAATPPAGGGTNNGGGGGGGN